MSGASSERYSKKQRKPAPAPTRAAWIGFVKCELNEGQKDDLAAMPFSLEDCHNLTTYYISRNCKFTASYDAKNTCFIASITDNDPESENAGWTLVGRGSVLLNALNALFYKSEIVLKNASWGQFSAESRGSDFG